MGIPAVDKRDQILPDRWIHGYCRLRRSKSNLL